MWISIVAQQGSVGFYGIDWLIEIEIARSNDSDGFGVPGVVANDLLQHGPCAI